MQLMELASEGCPPTCWRSLALARPLCPSARACLQLLPPFWLLLRLLPRPPPDAALPLGGR